MRMMPLCPGWVAADMVSLALQDTASGYHH